jgi:hypothetical protein
MTGREHEAKKVVSDIIVECGVEIRHGHLLLDLELAAKLTVFAFEQLAAAQAVDSTMLRRSHQPCTGVIRDPRLGPLLEGRDKGILRKFFGKTDIAQHAREAGDDTGGLDAPDGVDGAVCIGSCHDYR